MSLNWCYPETSPFVPQGKNTTALNFAREDRSSLGILVREALQNSLDAPADGKTGAIRVSIKQLQPGTFDSDYLNHVFNHEFRERLKAAQGPDLPDARAAKVLVIEDFGTKGLIGSTRDTNKDGPDENWNAFWHREGEGAKGASSNGGAGQGKVTYYSQSNARTVLGLTRRSTDNKIFLMGRASFPRDYPFQRDKKFCRSAYWTRSMTTPEPESNPSAINEFVRAFNLSSRDTDPGLSLVIPFAKELDQDEAIRTVILDFFTPIVSNRLEVIVGQQRISASTIDSLADALLPDEKITELGSSFTKGYREFVKGVILDPTIDATMHSDWSKDRNIPEAAFPQEKLQALRTKLELGKRIGITLPIKYRPRGEPARDTKFDVYIQAPDALARNEEAFIRNDLLIGAEKPLSAGTLTTKVRSLTWIQTDISEFLLAAEEPTHLKWNAARAKDHYSNPEETLRSIRQAVPRLLGTLLAGIQKKDTRALNSFFPRPSTTQSNAGGQAGQNKQKETQNRHENPPPLLKQTPLLVSWSKQKAKVCMNPKAPPSIDKLPFRASIEFAYLGFGDDGFNEYDPYDFDLSQEHLFPITVEGGKIASRSDNRIEIDVVLPSFVFTIAGFDPHFRVRHRLTYDLASNDDNNEADEEQDDSTNA